MRRADTPIAMTRRSDSDLSLVTPVDTPAVPSTGRSDAERLLEGIIAISREAVVSTDETQHIVIFNPAAERIFGYGRDEVIGQPLDRLLPLSSRGAHHAHIDRFRHESVDRREMSEHGRIWGRRKSGELFPAEASISKTTVGGRTYLTAVLRDLSEERRVEKERASLLSRTRATRAAAQAAEQRMKFLANASEILHSSLAVEQTFDALLHLIVPEHAICCMVDLLDDDGRVRRAHIMHGDPMRPELLERLSTYPRQGQTRYLTRRAIEEGEPELIARVTDEVLRAAAEDDDHFALLRELRFSSVIVVPLRGHGRVLGAVLLARGDGQPPYTMADLSLAEAVAVRAAAALENARLYDEARRAIQARNDVLGVVSHDLRTPLSVIAMCARAMLGEGFTGEAHDQESLQTIQRSAHWAQRLIQDLLDVSAIEAGGLSLTRRREDPRVLVARAIDLHGELATERNIEVVSDLLDELPALDVDADRIVQALGNLIGNAVKFTPYGGEVHVGAVDAGHRLRLYVRDSGPGIAAEHAPHVFDRYWTGPSDGRVRGTGMGLAIARGIVDAHGGSVWLEPTDPGQGAMFCFELPVAPARAG
jgi:PAS domain S-box-containing protein